MRNCPAGCGSPVAEHTFVCHECWLRLPHAYRAAITHHQRRDPLAHAHALSEAVAWFVHHPPERSSP